MPSRLAIAVLAALLTAFLLAPAAAPAAGDKAAAGPFTARIEGDRATVVAGNTPLQDILAEFAAQGVRVLVDPGINPRITMRFENRGTQRTLEALLKGLDYVLTWSRAPGGTAGARLTGIEVFDPGNRGGMVRVIRRPTLDVVTGPNGERYVARELLVRIRTGATPEQIQDLLDRLGAYIAGVEPASGLLRLVLPEGADLAEATRAALAHPAVAGAAKNSAYPLPETAAFEEEPERTLPLPEPGSPDGVPVAVLDSGLSPDVDLGGLVSATLDALAPDAPMDDTAGHGTQMALLAAGLVVPHSGVVQETATNPVIAVRAFDDNGNTSDFHLARAVEFAVKRGAKVLSLSWGGNTPSGTLEAVLEAARAKGVVVVAAAGNEPTGNPVYPAAYDSVIGVGALRPDGERWDQSNYGDSASVYAPGFASMPVGYNGEAGEYAGTSIATAYLANVIATHMARNPGLDAGQVYEALELGQ